MLSFFYLENRKSPKVYNLRHFALFGSAGDRSKLKSCAQVGSASPGKDAKNKLVPLKPARDIGVDYLQKDTLLITLSDILPSRYNTFTFVIQYTFCIFGLQNTHHSGIVRRDGLSSPSSWAAPRPTHRHSAVAGCHTVSQIGQGCALMHVFWTFSMQAPSPPVPHLPPPTLHTNSEHTHIPFLLRHQKSAWE